VEDVDIAFQSARGWGAEAAELLVSPTFSAGVDARVAELAALEHFPAMYTASSLPVTQSSGLMAFAINVESRLLSLAEYIDKILRGQSPADLPVVGPRQYDFVVNVKAAKALGITFPPDAAAQVRQWIQ
jgi:putative ABC transport system substrate-binding protein